MAVITKTSPLAPAGGFPELPAIEGVRFATAATGVKYEDRTDVMLAEICAGASVAGVFTQSATRSASVLDCQAKLGTVTDPNKGFAILVNSGNSNAFTGKAGVASVETVVAGVSQELDVPETHVYTSSTGVIGEPMEHDRITGALGDLKRDLSANGVEAAARAIMTTDTFAKGYTITTQTEAGTPITIMGIAKGSGMIAPDMATMLVYVFTDAKISQPVLQDIVSRTNEVTFNCITVDSDTSTSDTLLAVATGKADMAEYTDATTGEVQNFAAALHQLMWNLAQLVVRDGEGATKLVEIVVDGAADNADAKKVAMACANSPLVKTAIAGEDANWGRIVMAIGKSGAQADRDKLSIAFGGITVAKNGFRAPDYSEEAASEYMEGSGISIFIDMGIGEGSATVFTCDLTHGYIEINADYRS